MRRGQPAAPAPAASPARQADAAAAAAASVAERPGDPAADRARLDFVDGSLPRPAGEDVVLAEGVGAPASALSLSAAPASPARATVPAPRLRAFQAATFGAQLASNALQVTVPLLLLAASGSPAIAAFGAALSSAVDAAGTLLGGRLSDRFGARAVLLGGTLARGAAVLALPALAAAGPLTVPAVLAVYMAESLARGVSDTARSVVPAQLAGRDEGALKSILARNQVFFEAGSLAGPFAAGALILAAGGAASLPALWLAPAAFAGVAAAYWAMPRPGGAPASRPAPAPSPRATLDGWTRGALAATALLTLYPLKAVLPAAFAVEVLGDPASAGWLAGLFGAGGLLGSLLYGRLSSKAGLKGWLTLGGLGGAALGAGFLPGAFLPAALGVLAFGAANAAARLSLNAELQSRSPEGRAGAAMGRARFTANLSSLGVRALAGLAFAAAVAPASAFWLVAAGGAAAGGGLIWAARRLDVPPPGAPRPSRAHGRPGRLVVVEGLDGSGKSTQLERLKERLEAEGLEVVLTTWNSSDLVSEAVKSAKKARALTPRTFSLLHAADLADRLDKLVLPALERGAIVLADRWFFTALARDRARGIDAAWLRRLYAFAPRPDLTLYFRLPVETAVARVLARSEGRLGLSEEHEPDGAARRGLKYYEAGLDAGLSADPLENFRLFQGRVAAEYDRQAREFGFATLDSSRGREEIWADAERAALASLGELSSFRKAPPAARNIFDKDPAGDPENIRANYAREKRGAHFYFRNMLLPMQERFAQLMDMRMPRVLLHGSPHVDNYAKTPWGAAMVDFDRARVGPYAWDLLRAMVSISLRRKKGGAELLAPEVLERLRKGYLHGFRHPERPFSEARLLKDAEPGPDELGTDAYLAAGKKWAAELRENPLPADDPAVLALLRSYEQGRGSRLLDEYFVEEAGRGQGSMGFRELFLVVLAPRDAGAGRDRIFLNIKRARTDPDTEWYKSPYGSEAERMLAASAAYAPGWDPLQGGARLDGAEYHVRQLPPHNAKIKKMMGVEEQADYAYALGTQLGRAHRLNLRDGSTPEQLEAHLRANFAAVAEAGRVIRDELLAAHGRYLDALRRR